MPNPRSKKEYTKLMAMKSALLSESKCILECLRKVREQRNCLEIERLQLESMLLAAKSGGSSGSTPMPDAGGNTNHKLDDTTTTLSTTTLDSTRINEELNLTVSKQSQKCSPMEEEEEEEN